MNVELVLLNMALNGKIDALIAEGVDEKTFLDPLNRQIYAVMTDIFRRSMPVDIASVCQMLPETRNVASRLAKAMEDGCTTLNSEYFVRLAKNASQNYAIATDIAALLRRHRENIYDGDILADIHAIIDHATRSDGQSIVTGIDYVQAHLAQVEADYLAGGINGPKTGIPHLDDIIGGGLMPGKLLTIAARPGAGKTALATNMAFHAAQSGFTPLYITIELTHGEIFDRILCTQGKIKVGDLANRKLCHEDFDRLVDSGRSLMATPIVINSTTQGSWEKAEMAIRLGAVLHNVKVVFIDYIQQFHMNSNKNMREELCVITSRCKQIALDLGIAVVIVAQLNREIERRGGFLPIMSDIKESGSLEQDSDVIMMIFEVQENDSLPPGHYLRIVKNRQGQPAILKLSIDLSVNKVHPESEIATIAKAKPAKKLKGVDRHWDND